MPGTTFFQELARRISDKSNGVFFITTQQRRSISLGLTDGWITYCSGVRKHGQQAIEQLLEADLASHRFNDDSDFPFRGHDEVIHEEAIALLAPLIGDMSKATEPPERPETKPDTNDTPIGVTTRIYRGQVVQTPTSPKSSKGETNTEGKPRGKRIYRGQVIND